MIKISIIVVPHESEDTDPAKSAGWSPTGNWEIKPKIIYNLEEVKLLP